MVLYNFGGWGVGRPVSVLTHETCVSLHTNHCACLLMINIVFLSAFQYWTITLLWMYCRYRIRLPTEKELEMKVSKDVKKMRLYESTLLSVYKVGNIFYAWLLVMVFVSYFWFLMDLLHLDQNKLLVSFIKLVDFESCQLPFVNLFIFLSGHFDGWYCIV